MNSGINEPDWKAIASRLESMEALSVTRNVALSEISRWEIGGLAELVVEPATVDALVAVITLCNASGWAYLVVGGTSNLLFSDDGLKAVLIRVGSGLASKCAEGTTIIAEAGCWVPGLARFSAARGLSGLEHTAGIPGTLGGLICMNGGSQRKGIGDSIVSVKAMMPDGEIKNFAREECGFSYRDSIFLHNGAVILSAVLNLLPGDVSTIRRDMLQILKSRREKFPLKQPNCGSIFASNPAMYSEIGPPGFALEKVGLKGFAIGGAQFSSLHANFILNNGTASSDDVLSLISLGWTSVLNDTGFMMGCEVRYVLPSGLTIKAHEVYPQ
jgi:UDP-N-acetylmuramate dehydrogenase